MRTPYSTQDFPSVFTSETISCAERDHTDLILREREADVYRQAGQIRLPPQKGSTAKSYTHQCPPIDIARGRLAPVCEAPVQKPRCRGVDIRPSRDQPSSIGMQGGSLCRRAKVHHRPAAAAIPPCHRGPPQAALLLALRTWRPFPKRAFAAWGFRSDCLK